MLVDRLLSKRDLYPRGCLLLSATVGQVRMFPSVPDLGIQGEEESNSDIVFPLTPSVLGLGVERRVD